MRSKQLIIGLMLVAALLLSVGMEVQAGCPSPVPTCASSGDVSVLDDIFGCTLVTTSPSGLITVGILEYMFDGAGDTMLVQTTNSNAPSGTTFMPWTEPSNGSYCINSDNQTGYITPATGCPVAFIRDVTSTFGGQVEVRLLDTTQNLASVAVCESQSLPN
jgi:hypothetical protein